MPRHRPSTGRALSAGAAVLLLAFACGTEAVGVEECRTIESARCRADAACQPRDFDVAACERFYRDHCLHGMALESAPGQRAVDDCAAAISAAGQCAAASTTEPLAACALAPETRPGDPAAQTACDVLDFPERLTACDFLQLGPAPPTPDAGSGDASPDDASPDADPDMGDAGDPNAGDAGE